MICLAIKMIFPNRATDLFTGNLIQSERRPLPTPPENFDKIISGEIKGKELIKMNQQAFDDYNTSVLEACTNCGRTFKPDALVRHSKGCKEDKPMVKNKGPGYTTQMKSKVNYPKLKKTKQEPKELPNNENLQSQSPSLIRKETITISKSIIPEEVEEVESRYEESDKSEKKAPSLCRKDTIVIHKNIKKDEPSVSNFEGESNNLAITKTLPPKPPKIQTEVIQKKNLVNGTSSEGKSQQSRPPFQGLKNKTLAKKTAEVPSKEDVIYLVETEAIFDSQEHRKAILDLVSNYAKNARKNQILEMLDHEIFENMDNLEELITVLNDFVAAKSNNNC